VRDEQSLRLEEAVHMFTGKVAAAIGVAGRGALRPGMAADVVVFDLEEIGAGPTRAAKDMPGGGSRLVTEATGIHSTIVGGRVTFERGRPTGDLAGGLLRSGGQGTRTGPS
jgi:N-acyl-D-aspartate/D-glutamate deacylase